MAGLSAFAKGVSLGTIEPSPNMVRERGDRLGEGEQLHVDLLGRAVPVVRTPEGLRAVSKGKPGDSVKRLRPGAGGLLLPMSFPIRNLGSGTIVD